MIDRISPCEQIPCDIVAGAGNSSHSPVTPTPEEKITRS